MYDWIIKNISTMDSTGGIKPIPDYPYARKLVDAIQNYRILFVAKSRQMMVTWIVCACALYKALHDEPGLYLLMSKGGRETTELIKRLAIIVGALDEEIRSVIKVKAEELVLLNGSRIVALPATEIAARMFSPTMVFWDEMAFTPHSEGIWTAIKPAVDSGGSFIGVSTPNGSDNAFFELFTDQGNGFGKLRLHYTEHPERGAEWLNEAKRGLSLASWKQEYEIDFDVLADRVFDEFDAELHVLKEPLDLNLHKGKLYRGIDFGYRHPYVVWVHVDEDGVITVFDEWEGHDNTAEEMAKAINTIDRKHGITETDFTWSGCDPAGAARSDVGISAVERLKKLGYKLKWRSSEIMTGIEIIKMKLRDASGLVSLHFQPSASRFLYHLQHYRWNKDTDQPLKDGEHDHAVDALRYLFINLFDQKKTGWTGAMVAGARR